MECEIDDITEGNTPLPQAMDTLAVMKMFVEIRGEIKDAGDRLQILEEGHAAEAETSKSTSNLQEKLKKEVETLKKRNMLLSGQVCRLTQTMTELQNKIEKMEINSAKKMVVLSRFYASSKNIYATVRSLL